MKQFSLVLGFIFTTFILAACGAAGLAEPALPGGQTAPAVTSRTVAPLTPAIGETAEPAATNDPLEPVELSAVAPFDPRSDAQGAVEVTAAPLFSPGPDPSLDFKITLDTHSVDLAFDLAALAELKTDTGVTLQPIRWDAPSGGHHVEGVLSFPARLDGKPALAGASRLILTIRDLDAPLRTFTWEW